MFKTRILIASFALAVLLGAGMAVVLTETASACGCPYPAPHIEYGPQCTCPSGMVGTTITRWQGYWDPYYTSDCCPFTYCSACPPSHVKGPYPAIYPDEPDGGW